MWCDELGRQLLLRHQQKARDGDGGSPGAKHFQDHHLNMHQTLQKPIPPGPQSYSCFSDSTMATMGWQPTPQPGPPPPGHGPPPPHAPHQGPQQQLSVVTTVWGVSTSTQSGPLSHNSFTGNSTALSSAPYSQTQQAYPNGPGGMPHKSYPPQGMPPRQGASGYNGYGAASASMTAGMGNTMPPSGPGGAGDYQTPSSALSTAALVAAATATATATASVVALQERQQQEVAMNSQYGQMQGMQGQQFQHGYGPPASQRMPSVPGMNSSLSNPMGGPMGNVPNQMHGAMAGVASNVANSVGHLGSMNSQMAMNGPMNKQAMQGMQGMGNPGQPLPNAGMYQTGSGPGMSPQPRGRPSPYPNPQQYLSQKRQTQYSPATQQYSPGMQPYAQTPQPTYNSAQYGGAQHLQFGKQPQQYGPSMQSQQQQPMQNPNYPPQQQMRPSMRPQAPPYNGQQSQYYQQGQFNGSPQQTQYEQPYTNQFSQGNMQQRSMNYQHSPIPGNPTPPLTPASNIPPYLSPNPDLKPTYPDMKPPLPLQKDDELRLTFPVRDGIILAPFRLEHNLAVSNHVFHLKPSVHQTLMWRSDLELQLKCFHHEDRQMNTNWPASVQVSVNATPLTIDRGENKTSHKPLYLKEVCQAGRNTIQITVTACCCSHLFLLQLVHRPTVRSVLQGLLRKRLLPAEHCIGKIKRNFTNVAASVNSTMNGEDGVEQTAIKVSLKCPITFKRITLPARGPECKHIQCFDLESYLQLNCERGSWRCPVCNKAALLEGLEVDQYMWGILTTLSSSDIEEVTIDATASWKPVPVKSIKEEHDSDPCAGPKRFKAMSPSSMTMPTTSTWEMGQGLLPPYSSLPPPDMQSLTNGPGMANGVSFGGSSFEFQSQASDFSSPLSQLNESVASLDPLVAMEKSLNHHEQQMGPPSLHEPNNQGLRHQPTSTPVSGNTQPQQSSIQQQPNSNPAPQPPSSQGQATAASMMQHGPHTPHTPGNAGGGGNSGPPSVPPPTSTVQGGSGGVETGSSGAGNGGHGPPSNQPSGNPPSASGSTPSLTHASDLGDLNFDPAAVIDGEGQGQEALNLLPESVVDPMELLSYLDPPDMGGNGVGAASNSSTSSTVTSTTVSNSGGVTRSASSSASDDLLALFES